METLLAVGIASKNRPEVLDRTLRKVHEFGLGNCPLLLFDDGSTPPLNPQATALFKNARLIRVNKSLGQAVGRNRICAAATTPFLLQLDDDSYPVAGDIRALLSLVSKGNDWLAIAIPFDEPGRGLLSVGTPEEHLIPVRSFVGCSALLHVANFRRLGGYASWIGGICEEDELAVRGWKADLATLSINILKIRHDVTSVGRSLSGITYRSFRNWLLTWALHAPGPIVPLKVIRLIGAAGIHSVKHCDLAALRGVFAAMRVLPSLLRYRDALSLAEYRRLKILPHALDFVGHKLH